MKDRIIDFRVRLPFKDEFPDADPGDLSFVPHWMSHYVELYQAALKVDLGVETLLASMEQNGIERAVMQAEWEFGDYKHLNNAVHKIVTTYPDKFIGFCTVHPEESKDMAAELRDWVAAGMRGVNLQPWAYRMEAHDRRFYPVYEVANELGIPVTVHTSVNWTLTRPIFYGRPINLDVVACDFPDLVLIASHGGWPWVNEMVAVAWKHPNVYIETGAVSPKYIGRPGTGWETFIQYADSILKKQILYASEWPLLTFERVVAEAQALPLKEEVKRAYLYENAKRLLGI